MLTDLTSKSFARILIVDDEPVNLRVLKQILQDQYQLMFATSAKQVKPGKLTDDEMIIMRQHALIGAEILGDCDSTLMQMASSVARYHHEKWDGSGYPLGLKETAIPIEARIVALTDVFDALTSERPYKKAWSVAEALDFIKSQAGKHFDPALVPLLEQELPKILVIKARWAD
ncbi:hypothetical protein ALON55S_04766 [Alishewanella longhuensis]